MHPLAILEGFAAGYVTVMAYHVTLPNANPWLSIVWPLDLAIRGMTWLATKIPATAGAVAKIEADIAAIKAKYPL